MCEGRISSWGWFVTIVHVVYVWLSVTGGLEFLSVPIKFQSILSNSKIKRSRQTKLFVLLYYSIFFSFLSQNLSTSSSAVFIEKNMLLFTLLIFIFLCLFSFYLLFFFLFLFEETRGGSGCRLKKPQYPSSYPIIDVVSGWRFLVFFTILLAIKKSICKK